jgi:hypothetical protein
MASGMVMLCDAYHWQEAFGRKATVVYLFVKN